MSSYLDIVGSVIIAGMIILNFAVFMGERQESQIESTNKVTAQTEMSDITQTLRHDLRKLGYGCDTLAIINASPRQLVFRADLDNDGKVDTVGYAFADAIDAATLASVTTKTTTLQSEVTTSEYSTETIKVSTEGYSLHRVVNGRGFEGSDADMTGFHFKYYTTNSYGTLIETTSVGDIRAIGVVLRLRSKMKQDGEYKYSLNEFTVSPKNLI